MTQQLIILLTAIFSSLFICQTAIFTYLLIRLKRKSSFRRAGKPVIIEELPSGIQGSIPESVMRILREVGSSGSLSAREISRRLGLSREHTARTLKKLVEEGFLLREGKPYRYRITELGEKLLRSREIT